MVAKLKECLCIYKDIPILMMILVIYLIIASYFDIKERRIPNILNITFLIIRLLLIPFIGIGKEHLLGAIFSFLIFFIPSFITLHKMAGDIKMAFVVGLYLSIQPVILLVGVSLFFCIIYIIIRSFKKKKSESIAYAPFFLLSLVFLWVISLIIL